MGRGCGCLASTLLHEGLHIRYKLDLEEEKNDSDRAARDDTKRCIDCARDD